MKRTNCHCGLWIRSAKQERLFAENWLKKLDEIHQSMHDISDHLFKLYGQGKIKPAIDGLQEIQKTYQKMDQLLQQYTI